MGCVTSKLDDDLLELSAKQERMRLKQAQMRAEIQVIEKSIERVTKTLKSIEASLEEHDSDSGYLCSPVISEARSMHF